MSKQRTQNQLVVQRNEVKESEKNKPPTIIKKKILPLKIIYKKYSEKLK